LVLVSRDQDRLRAVAEQIRDVHDVAVEVLPADLSDRGQLERVAVRLTDPVEPVDLLVNNAGYGLRGGFLEIGVEDHEKQMDTLMKAGWCRARWCWSAVTRASASRPCCCRRSRPW